MTTLQQFASKPETILASTSWYLADLGEARGKQELFTKQCPGVSVDLIRQVLKNLHSRGRVKCLGRGQSAEWQRTAKWK